MIETECAVVNRRKNPNMSKLYSVIKLVQSKDFVEHHEGTEQLIIMARQADAYLKLMEDL